jgi:predicted phosphodiesterase
MRYAIFTDIHANLEALETVLAKIDEIAQEEPIDQIWFLGDLVGYGPNPNECIDTLRTRTDVIIAGNHDWAAVGKLDLEDFSAAARISAEWTAEQLTEEHREFLRNLPERLEMGKCTLVHGSPYGPLWEYLTSEMLAERSFQHFESRFCLVGHTHVPVIFQQAYTFANEPTEPLASIAQDIHQEETAEMAAVILTSQKAEAIESAYLDTAGMQDADEQEAFRQTVRELVEAAAASEEHVPSGQPPGEAEAADSEQGVSAIPGTEFAAYEIPDTTTSESDIKNAEDRLNNEIEELLELLGLSQSMIQVTNEMLQPPEGLWEPPSNHRRSSIPGGSASHATATRVQLL